MKKLITILVLLSTMVLSKNYSGSIRLRFRHDAWLALTPEQVEKRQEMVAELYDWEHPNKLHAYPTDLPKPTKREFGIVVDKDWICSTQNVVTGEWMGDTNYYRHNITNLTDQWYCYHPSNTQTDNKGTFAWANSWRSQWQSLNPKFKIDRIEE